MIALGSSDMAKAYVGSTEVSKVYLGSDLVYQANGSRLPAGYTEIDYLSSDGTEYVNTGQVQKTRNFIMEIKFKWTGSTDSQFETFIGYMPNGSSVTPRCGIHKYNGKWMYGTNATNTTTIAVDGNIHVARIESKATGNKETFFLDGTQISQTTTTSTGLSNNTIPFYIFARNRKTSIDNPASADIYFVKYTSYSDSNYSTISAEYEYIPCYNSNNVYGFFELKNSNFCQKTTI